MIKSKLPETGNTIFSVMSQMAREHNAINLSQGFPNFDVDTELIDLVSDHMLRGHNQYAPMGGLPQLQEVIADKILKLYNRRLTPGKEITITAGATQAIFTAITALVHPGDEVVIVEPAYDCYRPAIEINGGIVRPFSLNKPDFKIYWSELAELVNEKTKMIVLNSPHNPTGQLLKWEDYNELTSLVEKYPDLYVLSDEVYEHITFEGHAHESVLSFDALWPRCMAAFSFGKTFHATGWKTGYLVAPEDLTAEIRKVHQYNVFCANAPIQHALADYLENDQKWQQLPAFYEKKRNLMEEILASTPLETIKSLGTYYLMADYSEFSKQSDTDFAEWMTRDVGVAVIPPSAFYSDGLDEGLVRICFAKKEETLLRAGERLQKL